ncbi:CotH kinase family protein [Eubacterium xylanophilum]|uniref:CotH kinase family protein n=1 Tax=Eubacterium xylanophilum TaxID=39497 RepID=UPI00047CBFC8|nr:CotH kinase family protein [Eubacterium xylanophilum]
MRIKWNKTCSKRLVGTMLALSLILSGVPTNVMASEPVQKLRDEEPIGEGLDGQGTEIAEPETQTNGTIPQNIIDEAIAAGVPDAFVRHSFADEADKLEAPAVELADGEEDPGLQLKAKKTGDETEGLVLEKVDTGVLARTKIDLGEFNFGEDGLKPGKVIFNMLASKKLKGKAKLYFGESDESFATINIRRCASSDWEAPRNCVGSINPGGLKGKEHIYLVFEAESGVNEDGVSVGVSGEKGSLYIESMFFTEGSTPVISIDVDKEINNMDAINGSPKHTVYGAGDMTIEIPEGYKAQYTDDKLKSATYELEYIRGRGNSTWETEKKPYKLKLEKSSDLFGMGKSKHWVLMANYYDFSLLRNKFTNYLGEKMDLEFTPKSVCADVIVDGEFYGSYQLSQHVRIGKNNVNIDDLEDKPASTLPEISGGYLLSMGTSWLSEDDDKVDLMNVGGNIFRIEKPEYDSEYPEDARDAQKNYINGYLKELNAAVESLVPEEERENINSEDETEEEPVVVPEGRTWRDYMDEQSFIDYALIQEVSKNGDAYGSGSTYLYKKRSDKLFWGPLWDFDYVAWGAVDFTDGQPFGGFATFSSCPWFSTLFKYDEEFKQNVLKRWEKLSAILKEGAGPDGFIDEYAKEIYYSALANYQVRKTYFSDYGMDMNGYDGYDDGNYGSEESEESYVINYGNEIQRYMAWINCEAEWLDENLKSYDGEGRGYYQELPPIKFYVDDNVVSEVTLDPRTEGIVESDFPEEPTKDGYKFIGWEFRQKTNDGEELEPQFLEVGDFPFHYSYDEEDNETIESYKIVAKFIPLSEYKVPESITFARDTVFYTMYSDDSYYEDYEEGASTLMPEEVDMANVINVRPFNADKKELKWTVTPQVEGVGDMTDDEIANYGIISKSGKLTAYQPVDFVVTCEYKNLKATVNVRYVSQEELKAPKTIYVAKSLEMNPGEYGDVNFSFDSEVGVTQNIYNSVVFKSADEDVVEVSNNGEVYAKTAGNATIVTVYRNIDTDDYIIKTTKVSVKGDEPKVTPAPATNDTASAEASATPSAAPTVAPTKPAAPTVATAAPTVAPNKATKAKKPAKAKVVKVSKKKKSTKVKVKVKSQKGVKGYQVAVFKSSKDAKKGKKAILKKVVKKANATLKSKKLKNKKKVYVKVRAFKKDGKKTVYGKWSAVKKS